LFEIETRIENGAIRGDVGGGGMKVEIRKL